MGGDSMPVVMKVFFFFFFSSFILRSLWTEIAWEGLEVWGEGNVCKQGKV